MRISSWIDVKVQWDATVKIPFSELIESIKQMSRESKSVWSGHSKRRMIRIKTASNRLVLKFRWKPLVSCGFFGLCFSFPPRWDLKDSSLSFLLFVLCLLKIGLDSSKDNVILTTRPTSVGRNAVIIGLYLLMSIILKILNNVNPMSMKLRYFFMHILYSTFIKKLLMINMPV